jgi:hypothetical protein
MMKRLKIFQAQDWDLGWGQMNSEFVAMWPVRFSCELSTPCSSSGLVGTAHDLSL